MAAFTVIEHDELSSAAATWTSGTLPTTYDHLYIVVSQRVDTGTGANYSGTWQFNGDTGANYAMTDIQTYRAGIVGTYRISSGTALGYPNLTGEGSVANTFGTMTVWIPNYANTSNYKPLIINSNNPNASITDSEWSLKVTAGMWRSTAAITSFTLGTNGTHNYMQYSNYTVYGVTGA